MTYHLSYTKECSIYPGEYIPLPEKEALLEQLNFSESDSGALLVNMNEFTDFFKVEATIPGVQREDIFIYVQDNVLSIIVLHKNCEQLKKKLKIHEFDGEFFKRHILLPKNADTEFVSAEYNQGLLTLHLPKTKKPVKNSTRHIVIY